MQLPRREDGSLALHRPVQVLERAEPSRVAPGPAIPAYCLRSLHSPIDRECHPDCVGVQEDGGCLCDIVRAAQAAGVEWSFEIDERTGQWVYNGDPL